MAAFRAANLLNGANELDVLDFAETYPVVVNGQGYVFGPSSTVDYSNVEAIKDAISAHKAVYWGVDAGYLQQCVGDVSGWVAPIITTPQTQYDHAVFSPDYATLDQCATYINQQRGVTVTYRFSLDPTMLCCHVGHLGHAGHRAPAVSDGKTDHRLNTSGEAHVIESFPAPCARAGAAARTWPWPTARPQPDAPPGGSQRGSRGDHRPPGAGLSRGHPLRAYRRRRFPGPIRQGEQGHEAPPGPGTLEREKNTHGP